MFVPLWYNFDDLVQDCSNSSTLAMELLQSCTEPSICLDSLSSRIQSRPEALLHACGFDAYVMSIRLYSIIGDVVHREEP